MFRQAVVLGSKKEKFNKIELTFTVFLSVTTLVSCSAIFPVAEDDYNSEYTTIRRNSYKGGKKSLPAAKDSVVSTENKDDKQKSETGVEIQGSFGAP
jgi:cell fate regulator YaaT (PSP1 superfamily)